MIPLDFTDEDRDDDEVRDEDEDEDEASLPLKSTLIMSNNSSLTSTTYQTSKLKMFMSRIIPNYLNSIKQN